MTVLTPKPELTSKALKTMLKTQIVATLTASLDDFPEGTELRLPSPLVIQLCVPGSYGPRYFNVRISEML